MSPSLKRSAAARFAYVWISAFVDPLRPFHALRRIGSFFRDYRAYRAQGGAERVRVREMMPVLSDRSGAHELDAHYFFGNAWVARKIAATSPARHVDVASQVALPSILAASRPVVYVDYRPLHAHIEGFTPVAGNLVQLPFRNGSIQSLSCIHVAEHVGLGRYGDPIDVAGTRKAAAELARVLAPGGNLFFAVPAGRERVVFNAHRVHDAATIQSYFPTLTLRELSGVDDRGRYMENVTPDAFRSQEYGCAFFWFTR